MRFCFDLLFAVLRTCVVLALTTSIRLPFVYLFSRPFFLVLMLTSAYQRTKCQEKMISIQLDSAADPITPVSFQVFFPSHLCLFFFFSPACKLLQASAGKRAATEYCRVASPWQRPQFSTSIMQRAALLIHEKNITGFRHPLWCCGSF